jgi:hypothetical protein
MEMAGMEEAEVMTVIKGLKNDVRKEKGGHHYNAGYMRLNWI